MREFVDKKRKKEKTHETLKLFWARQYIRCKRRICKSNLTWTSIAMHCLCKPFHLWLIPVSFCTNPLCKSAWFILQCAVPLTPLHVIFVPICVCTWLSLDVTVRDTIRGRCEVVLQVTCCWEESWCWPATHSPSAFELLLPCRPFCLYSRPREGEGGSQATESLEIKKFTSFWRNLWGIVRRAIWQWFAGNAKDMRSQKSVEKNSQGNVMSIFNKIRCNFEEYAQGRQT